MSKYKDIAQILDDAYLDIDGTIDLFSADSKFEELIEEEQILRHLKNPNSPAYFLAWEMINLYHKCILSFHHMSCGRKQTMKWVMAHKPNLIHYYTEKIDNYRKGV